MIRKILCKENLSKQDLLALMRVTEPSELNELYQKAYEVKEALIGKKAHYRGLIELSNMCMKNCRYCGIRAGNSGVERFHMTKAEIVDQARWAYENQFGSVVLQSGERQDCQFETFISEVVSDIKAIGGGALGITLSLGEQSARTYERWFACGAHRYLLRIETSSEALYRTLHPHDALHDFQRRLHCLELLRKTGYQVGTGVMIGLPGQTEEDLVNDILFFKDMDIDMIGMGPYIIHKDTPLGREALAGGMDSDAEKQKRLALALKMIAVTRLYLKDVNIASTTALQAMHPFGRELGLKAGANVLMPMMTLPHNRKKYQLYDGKPFLDDDARTSVDNLTERILAIGETVGFGERGDSKHFGKKQSL